MNETIDLPEGFSLPLVECNYTIKPKKFEKAMSLYRCNKDKVDCMVFDMPENPERPVNVVSVCKIGDLLNKKFIPYPKQVAFYDFRSEKFYKFDYEKIEKTLTEEAFKNDTEVIRETEEKKEC